MENSTVEAFGAYALSWAKSDFSGQVTTDASVPVKVIKGKPTRPCPRR
jgi:hypothetical protein